MYEVTRFFSTYPKKTFKPKQAVIRFDQPITEIYYLLKGKIAQYSDAQDGNELVIHIFGPGAFFPTAMVLTNISNRFSFRAKTQSVARVAPAKEVMKFLQQNPDVLYDLTKRLSRGLFGIVSRLENALGLKAQERIMSLLAYLAKSHGDNDGRNRKISFPLTHSDISAWLGLSRETVNRQMRHLEKKRYISYTRKAIIVKRTASRIQD